MPDLSSLTLKKVKKALKTKGFTLEKTQANHSIYYHPETRKCLVIPVRREKLPVETAFEILRQAGIYKDELED